MSDPNPMNRPTPDPARSNVPPPVDPPPGEPRKGANPLVWIVVLVALLALAWYFMSQRDTVEAPPEPATPIGQADDAAEDAAPAAARPTPRPSTPAASRPAVQADRDASVLASVEPEYPVAAARARDSGTVLVRAQVDASGKPTEVEVARSSRSRELDRAAVDAVRQWTFEPAIRDGKAVASTVQVPVEFTLSQQ
jgi:periplasmic protein TonB